MLYILIATTSNNYFNGVPTVTHTSAFVLLFSFSIYIFISAMMTHKLYDEEEAAFLEMEERSINQQHLR